MPYKIFADITVVIHFLWILFLIFGVFLGIRSRGIKIIHITGVVFALVLQIFSWYCPLTYLEVWLRAQHDPAYTYTGSFIIHYVERLVYLEVSRTLLFALTACIGALNVWIYWKKWKKVERRKI
jgi:hypothetical protein